MELYIVIRHILKTDRISLNVHEYFSFRGKATFAPAFFSGVIVIK